MLVSQRQVSGSCMEHGCFSTALTELQRSSAAPSNYRDGLRKRLLVLAERLARVQSLGGEYARVAFSEHAEAVLAEDAVVVRQRSLQAV